MSYPTVIAGVMGKYGTLLAANFPSSSRPPIYLGEATQQTAAQAQLRPPYVIIRDAGGKDAWDFESNCMTSGGFSLEVYYSSDDAVADCGTAMNAILYNGSNPNQDAGIAFMTLDLTPPLYATARGVTPTTDQYEYVGLDYQGKRTYRYTQDFEAVVETRGTG